MTYLVPKLVPYSRSFTFQEPPAILRVILLRLWVTNPIPPFGLHSFLLVGVLRVFFRDCGAGHFVCGTGHLHCGAGHLFSTFFVFLFHFPQKTPVLADKCFFLKIPAL